MAGKYIMLHSIATGLTQNRKILSGCLDGGQYKAMNHIYINIPGQCSQAVHYYPPIPFFNLLALPVSLVTP